MILRSFAVQTLLGNSFSFLALKQANFNEIIAASLKPLSI
jgi:hypothetical protein